jgi:hypothetical protein
VIRDRTEDILLPPEWRPKRTDSNVQSGVSGCALEHATNEDETFEAKRGA